MAWKIPLSRRLVSHNPGLNISVIWPMIQHGVRCIKLTNRISDLPKAFEDMLFMEYHNVKECRKRQFSSHPSCRIESSCAGNRQVRVRSGRDSPRIHGSTGLQFTTSSTKSKSAVARFFNEGHSSCNQGNWHTLQRAHYSGSRRRHCFSWN